MNPLCPLPWPLLPPRLRVKMSSLRKPVRSAPKATLLRCLRASASKSHSRVAQPVPPRPRPWHGTLRFPSGNPSAPHRRPPSSVASPRQNHSLPFPIPFHHGGMLWWGGLQPANPSQARTLLPPCLRVKMSSHRRPPSSAVSALVLSLTSPLLCAYLRVSASPRQNHSLRFPIPFPHGLIRGMELCVLYVSAVNPLSPTPELPHPDSP